MKNHLEMVACVPHCKCGVVDTGKWILGHALTRGHAMNMVHYSFAQ